MKNIFIKSILEEYEKTIHNTNKEYAEFFSTWFLQEKKENYLEEKKKNNN